MKRRILLLLTTCVLAPIALEAEAQPPQEDPVPAAAVICGKLDDQYLTCAFTYGTKGSSKCSNTGVCDANDNCKPKSGSPAAFEVTFPITNWQKKFYLFTELAPEDEQAKEIESEEQYCYRTFSCKSKCVLSGGAMRCKVSSTEIAKGSITKFSEAGDCPPVEEDPQDPGDPQDPPGEPIDPPMPAGGIVT